MFRLRMYIVNIIQTNVVPRTKSWNVPALNTSVSEDWPLTATLMGLPDRKHLITGKTFPKFV